MTNVYRSKEFDNAAKSRSWLNFLAKKAVEDKNFHVVLTLTQSVGFIKENPSSLPTFKYGAELIFPKKFLRAGKEYLAIKKAQSIRKTCDERQVDMKSFIKTVRAKAERRINEGQGPDVCNFEYDLDKFTTKSIVYLESFESAPLAQVHEYVARRTKAMATSKTDSEKYKKDLIRRAFREFTPSDIKRIQNYKTWKVNEALRLEARAEFFNHQVEFWKKKLQEKNPEIGNHKLKVRKYIGHYGEPYFYNRRDVFIPQYAFCETFPEPVR